MSSLVISNLQDSQHPNNSFLRELTEKECTALIGGNYAAYREGVTNPNPPLTERNASLELDGEGVEKLLNGNGKVPIDSLIQNLLPMQDNNPG